MISSRLYYVESYWCNIPSLPPSLPLHFIPSQVNLLAQDTAEGRLCIHYAAESAHAAAPDIVQFLCKKQADLLEAKVYI